jgi:hypothetical protein
MAAQTQQAHVLLPINVSVLLAGLDSTARPTVAAMVTVHVCKESENAINVATTPPARHAISAPLGSLEMQPMAVPA